MCLNLSKCKTLQFKGSMSVCMKKQNIPGMDLMKDLGLIVTNNLSWTEHAKTRSAKSLKAFFSLKRNLANSSTISTKKNAYRGYVTFDQNVKNAISAEFEFLAASLPDW